jgi:hypothetical protein
MSCQREVAMSRVACLLAAWSILSTTASGTRYEMSGEIVGYVAGSNLFDEGFVPSWGFPNDGAPVPYSGVLSYEPERSMATFEISIDTCMAIGFCEVDLITGNVRPILQVHRLAANLFDSVTQNDAAALQLYYTPSVQPGEWTRRFLLAADKSTGKGSWSWSYGPTLICNENVCAPSVPDFVVAASITDFHEVPEPICFALWVGLCTLELLGMKAARKFRDAESRRLDSIRTP